MVYPSEIAGKSRYFRIVRSYLVKACIFNVIATNFEVRFQWQ